VIRPPGERAPVTGPRMESLSGALPGRVRDRKRSPCGTPERRQQAFSRMHDVRTRCPNRGPTWPFGAWLRAAPQARQAGGHLASQAAARSDRRRSRTRRCATVAGTPRSAFFAARRYDTRTCSPDRGQRLGSSTAEPSGPRSTIYSAPMTLKSWLTKMWCGQLTPM
jgi:hypothetical protein